MYKVLFVDDEVLTREAIAAKTPWNEAGFTLIGTAENGKDAIEFMERERPDLLITDIYMPVMDGLELSRYVSINYPDMKIMILSGYDEFEYAKQALKCGVCEYMLKPITSAELIETLLKLKSRLDADNSSRDQIEKMRRDYEDNMPI
ncbi:MAG: response regulator, partial [Clostridiales bacterium]|nr:response regulator [Clostridiales bacterium]